MELDGVGFLKNYYVLPQAEALFHDYLICLVKSIYYVIYSVSPIYIYSQRFDTFNRS